MATPKNKSLYNRVKAEAKKKFKAFPSAYASAWIVKTYKKRGGTYAWQLLENQKVAWQNGLKKTGETLRQENLVVDLVRKIKDVLILHVDLNLKHLQQKLSQKLKRKQGKNVLVGDNYGRKEKS